MKRQMKIAAVVSATALLAIGASFTSMAAAKSGNWQQGEDGNWYCYDKNDDVYENEFCLSNGYELYVGDDGAMVTNSWVEHDGYMYYIQSDGTKTINNWKLLTPYEDPDAEEEWYYFGTSGKRAEAKKQVVGTETFYFDAEGKVIYGWVDTDDYTQADEGDVTDGDGLKDLIYTNERGARVTKDWVKAYAPGVDLEEDDLDDYTQGWYYLKSLGAPTTGKAASIEGETYFFGADGRMLSGWIAYDDSEEAYVEIDAKNYGKSLAQHKAEGDTIYFACTVDGHVKKNKWVYEWNNQKFGEADPDNGKNWYWIEKDGKVFVPYTDSVAMKMSFNEGAIDVNTASNATTKVIGNEIYAFDNNGKMLSGLVTMADGDMYYFGGAQDGARKIGAQTIADDLGDSYKFYFGTEDDNGYEKGVAITGAKNGKLYINGLLRTAKDYKYEVVDVDGVGTFIINNSGSIQTSKKLYEDDGYFVACADDAATCVPTIEFETKAGVKKGSVKTGTLIETESHATTVHNK